MADTPPEQDARLSISTGTEFEAIDQSYGFETWFDPTESIDWSAEAQLETLRNEDREREVLAVASIAWRPVIAALRNPAVELEGRWSESRRVMTVGGEATSAAFGASGWSLRQHLFIEEEEEVGERLTSGEELLYLQWRRELQRDSWSLALRSTVDLSWSDASSSEPDSLSELYAYFLDYQKLSLGVGLFSRGLSSASLYFDLTRKWSSGEGSAYTAGALDFYRDWFGSSGFCTLGLRVERRVYEAAGDSLAGYSSGLRPYWEGEWVGRWSSGGEGAQVETDLRLTGTAYDEYSSAAEESVTVDLDDLGSIDTDRLRLEFELLAARDLLPLLRAPREPFGGEDAWIESPWLESLRYGAGLAIDRLWLAEGAGEFTALGARFELSARCGRLLGGAWLELALESGYRNYRGDGDALALDLAGLSFSFAQSDYAYVEASLVGGGRLPAGFEWEGYAFLDTEIHTGLEDDAHLLAVTIALTRRWDVLR